MGTNASCPAEITELQMKSQRIVLFLLSFVLCIGGAATIASSNEHQLPEGFVYLRSVDPTILQSMRYHTEHNFLGRPVVGYQAPECILTAPAATQLAAVQARLLPQGMSLKVYDCYRPARAVADFVAWAKDLEDTRTKAEFYPTVSKNRLFELGYIAERSGHSRGSTVDLAIVKLPPAPEPHFDPAAQQSCSNSAGSRYRDNSLDFGTGYDCFHELSHTLNSAVGQEAATNRALLLDQMGTSGFTNYDREWWHFTLAGEPYPETYFDFPILPMQ